MSDTGSVRIAAGRNRSGIGRKTTANNTTTTTALPTTTGIGVAGKRPPTSMPIAEGQEQRGRDELDEPLGKVFAAIAPTTMASASAATMPSVEPIHAPTRSLSGRGRTSVLPHPPRLGVTQKARPPVGAQPGLADCQPPLLRIPGTAVFLNRGKQTAPLAMRANVKHNHALHEHVVIVAIDTVPVPRVPDSERTEVDALGYAKDGLFHVTAHFGYMETPNVLAALRLLDPTQTEGAIAIDDAP